MKIILIILSFCLILGCKTKRVLKTKNSKNEIIQTQTAKKQESQIEKVEQKQETKKVDLVEQKKESQTEIEVKGKAEDNKPIELYNIENGDTLQSIKVTGNADVSIRTKTKKSDQIAKENISLESNNKLEEIAKQLIKEDNLKEVGKEINSTVNEVKVKGFQPGLWIVVAIVSVFLIFIFFAYKYFKK